MSKHDCEQLMKAANVVSQCAGSVKWALSNPYQCNLTAHRKRLAQALQDMHQILVNAGLDSLMNLG